MCCLARVNGAGTSSNPSEGTQVHVQTIVLKLLASMTPKRVSQRVGQQHKFTARNGVWHEAMDVPKKAPNLEIQRDEKKTQHHPKNLVLVPASSKTQHQLPPYLSPSVIVSV